MKQRVLVMNGSRLLESDTNGKWVVQKVEPAGVLKPGIYNIFNARSPESEGKYRGTIIHTDKSHVFQEVKKGMFIKHSAGAFEKTPAIGSNLSVEYSAGRARVDNSQSQARSRSR